MRARGSLVVRWRGKPCARVGRWHCVAGCIYGCGAEQATRPGGMLATSSGRCTAQGAPTPSRTMPWESACCTTRALAWCACHMRCRAPQCTRTAAHTPQRAHAYATHTFVHTQHTHPSAHTGRTHLGAQVAQALQEFLGGDDEAAVAHHGLQDHARHLQQAIHPDSIMVGLM